MRTKGLIGLLLGVLLIVMIPVVAGHSEGAHVRVVSADPGSRTYAWICDMDPNTNFLRDYFVRADYGVFGRNAPNEVEILDVPAGQPVTYTFKEDVLYHLGCVIVDETDWSTLYRGDLHLDLRKQPWNPDIVEVSSSGMTATMDCVYSGAEYSASWRALDAATGVWMDMPDTKRVTFTAPKAGLFDFVCAVTDKSTGMVHEVGLPVEFFTDADPYFPNEFGVSVDESHEETTHSDEDTGTDTPTEDPSSNENACVTRLQTAAVSCTGGGQLVSDAYNGCRSLTCQSTAGVLKVLACEKPSNTAPQFFEMYLQDRTDAALDVCIGQTCLNGAGFVRSSPYGTCEETEAPSEDESPPQEDTEEVPNDAVCAQRLEQVQVSCNGQITLDSFNGCRTVSCEAGSGKLTVLACEKPDGNKPEFFEVYKQFESGSGVQICFGTTCLSESGFVKSEPYAACEEVDVPENTTEDPVDDAPVCAQSLELLPVSCTEAQVVEDSFNGCRAVTCAGASGEVSVLACEKPSNDAPEFFEMYLQRRSSQSIDVCIGNTCIGNRGFVKSAPYGVCEEQDDSEAGELVPQWIAPTNGLTGVAPDYFHIEFKQAGSAHVSTDFEVWNADKTERVWAAQSISGSAKIHVHTPDGVFESAYAEQSALDESTTYSMRARFRSADAAHEWSSWRSFTTSAKIMTAPGSPDWTAAQGFKVERFASGFDVPVHVAAAVPGMYDHLSESQRPFLYVTELYGQVKVVYADGSSAVYADDILNFDPFGSITGGGQMGTVGLYVDDVTGDVFVGTVYIEGDAVKNKIVRFYSDDSGSSFTHSETIIDDLPSAPSHQVQQITKGPDGRLYVGLGDALEPNTAQSQGVLAGKIVSMNLDGSDVQVYAKGFRNPFGLDWRPGFNQLFATDNAPDFDDRLLRVDAGGNYGWCCDISQRVFTLDVSPVDVEFDPGTAGFAGDRLYVAVAGPVYQQGEQRSKHILEFDLDTNGNIVSHREFVKYTGDGYGTPIGLEFAGGGLYFTDIYGEPGFVGLGETEGNVYRVVPGIPDACESCTTGEFRAGISIVPWYPKANQNSIEYIFECQGIDGSDNYRYSFDFGNGQGAFNSEFARQYQTYPYADQQYTVSCTVHDQSSGTSASAQMVINPGNFIAE